MVTASLVLGLAGLIPSASAATQQLDPEVNGPTTSLPAPKEPSRCDITGTDHNDTLRAHHHGLIICGLGGNDTLVGTKGHDVLRGGTGDDLLEAGAGDDELFGGDGADVCHQADGDGTLDHCEKPVAGIAVTTALSKVGDNYQWGADGPDAFDCSGLTMFSWNKAGVSLPHSSASQYTSLKHIRRKDLQPGDLVFFYKPIHHVAMYIGNGRMVHAENESSGVNIDPLAGYYSDHYTGAARPA